MPDIEEPKLPIAEPPKPETPKPPKERVITPDFQAAIDRLTAEMDGLKGDREAWKLKALALDKEIADLKAKGTPQERDALALAFHPWDLFFG